MTAKSPLFTLLMVAVASVSFGEDWGGLKLDFSRRTVTLTVLIDDLQDAYRVDPDGAVRMLANPATSKVADQSLVVEIAPGKKKTGVVRVTSDSRTSQVQVAADNRLAGPSRIGGLPFGYAFLPPGGRASEGETWEETFPPPVEGQGVPVAATFRYKVVGAAATDSCPDCIEIQIVGLRRFLPNDGLGDLLANVFSDSDDEFFTTNQVFAVGTVLFSPKAGLFERFELGVNTSMLTPLAVPGMMRRVVVTVVEVGP